MSIKHRSNVIQRDSYGYPLRLCIMECQDCGYIEQVWVRHERKMIIRNISYKGKQPLAELLFKIWKNHDLSERGHVDIITHSIWYAMVFFNTVVYFFAL